MHRSSYPKAPSALPLPHDPRGMTRVRCTKSFRTQILHQKGRLRQASRPGSPNRQPDGITMFMGRPFGDSSPGACPFPAGSKARCFTQAAARCNEAQWSCSRYRERSIAFNLICTDPEAASKDFQGLPVRPGYLVSLDSRDCLRRQWSKIRLLQPTLQSQPSKRRTESSLALPSLLVESLAIRCIELVKNAVGRSFVHSESDGQPVVAKGELVELRPSAITCWGEVRERDDVCRPISTHKCERLECGVGRAADEAVGSVLTADYGHELRDGEPRVTRASANVAFEQGGERGNARGPRSFQRHQFTHPAVAPKLESRLEQILR